MTNTNTLENMMLYNALSIQYNTAKRIKDKSLKIETKKQMIELHMKMFPEQYKLSKEKESHIKQIIKNKNE